MKTQNYRFATLQIMAAVLALTITTACSDEKHRPDDEKEPWLKEVAMEQAYQVSVGSTVTISAKGFKGGDMIVLNGTQEEIKGVSHRILIKNITDTGASVVIPAGTATGRYDIYAFRLGEDVLLLGRDVLIDVGADFSTMPLVSGKNIMGYVYCGGKPLEGVVVSDGYEVVTTDRFGRYYIGSAKKNGFVFVSVPGNYMPAQISGSNVPGFFRRVVKGVNITERHDFELFEENNENHVVIAAADFHLANRTKDKEQFRQTYIPALKEQVDANGRAGLKTYVVTLGDMTWDQFWSNGYRLNTYAADTDIRGVTDSGGRSVPYFNGMGNHDNDPSKTGAGADWDAEGEYRAYVGPVYYSFNLGKVHYVMLDNIEYLNAGGSRDYGRKVVGHQIEWLKKDLAALADKSTPIVVGTHSSLFGVTGVRNDGLGNAKYVNYISNYDEFMKCFSGFGSVTVLSGHAHKAYSITDAAYPNVVEHNVPAVCGTWWWTGYHLGSEVNVCTDGAPGGFGIVSAAGKDVKYRFKGYGLPDGKCFRTYDRNTIELSPAVYGHSGFTSTYTKPYHTASGANEVIINAWSWGPGWSISVTERKAGGGTKALTATPYYGKDPYHMVTYELQRIKAGANPTGAFCSNDYHHFFTVTASAPDTTLDIVLKDGYGNEYRETMARPKKFPVTDR